MQYRAVSFGKTEFRALSVSKWLATSHLLGGAVVALYEACDNLNCENNTHWRDRLMGTLPVSTSGMIQAWSSVNSLSQTQWDGRCGGRQPYWKQIKIIPKSTFAEGKYMLLYWKGGKQTWSTFSLEAVTAVWRSLGSLALSSLAVSDQYCIRKLWALFLILAWVVLISGVYERDCL